MIWCLRTASKQFACANHPTVGSDCGTCKQQVLANNAVGLLSVYSSSVCSSFQSWLGRKAIEIRVLRDELQVLTLRFTCGCDSHESDILRPFSSYSNCMHKTHPRVSVPLWIPLASHQQCCMLFLPFCHKSHLWGKILGSMEQSYWAGLSLFLCAGHCRG